MTNDKLRHHQRLTAETRAIADRRTLALSKPGKPMTTTEYINSLILADGKKSKKP